ncbi:hypothetical protein, partial [Salmonella enterica]
MSLTRGSLWLCKFVPDEFVAHLPPSCNANHLAKDLTGCPTAARLLIRKITMTEAMKITLSTQPADARWGDKATYSINN